jgi:hypothetical protein
MPICNSTALSEIFKPCENNSGGISEVYLLEQDDLVSYDVDFSAHTITAMTVTASFTQFELKRNVGGYESETPIDFTAGSTYFTHTLTLPFHRRESYKSRSIMILGEGQRYLAVLFKDNNGKYWFFDYAQVQTSTETSGVARADGSSYTVTIFAENEYKAYEIDESVIQGL